MSLTSSDQKAFIFVSMAFLKGLATGNIDVGTLAYSMNSPLDAIPERTRKAFDRKCYSLNMKCPPQAYVEGTDFGGCRTF